MGLHSPSSRKKVSLTGINRAKGKKYAFLVIEEAYEFTEREILDIEHAVGGYSNYIKIFITNPNSLAFPYIAKREKEFPHNANLLKTQGYQFKIQYNYLDIKIWFYANWRINQYIKYADVKSITDTWTVDASRARVVDYGMPGIEENGIYANEFEKVKQITLKQILNIAIKRVSIGIDWGDGAGETASATVAVITFQDYNNNTYTLPLYYHNNKDGYKTPQERTEEIIIQIKYIHKLKPSIGWTSLDVFLDTGLHAEKEFLEIAQRRQGLNFLSFAFADKYQERTRINFRKYRINTGRYFIINDDDRLFGLFMNELQLQVWDENKRDKQNLPKQKDAFNHLTDAEDYAICKETYTLAQEEQYNLLHKKW